jgi:hypothetical protein
MASSAALAAMLSWMVPVLFGVGLTTSVARVPLTRVNAPLVPPVTVTSSAVKLVPTSSLKLKVKVTSPVATASATLSVMVITGPVVSAGAPAAGGGASPLPPPQAASNSEAASAVAVSRWGERRVFMAVCPGVVCRPAWGRSAGCVSVRDGSEAEGFIAPASIS